VTLAGTDGHLQLGVYAALGPRDLGGRSRRDRTSLREQKATRRALDGKFGTELVGTVPAMVDAYRCALSESTGRGGSCAGCSSASLQIPPCGRYEDVLRNVIVVRGNEPLPVRDAVPLRLPKTPSSPIAIRVMWGRHAASGCFLTESGYLSHVDDRCRCGIA